MSSHDELVRSLLVERFTRHKRAPQLDEDLADERAQRDHDLVTAQRRRDLLVAIDTDQEAAS